MSKTLRQRLRAAASIGVAVSTSVLTLAIGTLAVGTGAASAAGTPPIQNNSCDLPSGTCVQGTNYTYAGRFDPSTIDGIRSTGSDTTFFMMQSLAALYNSAALYGGTVASDNTTITSADDGNTDDVDNFSRTEVVNGISDIGSTAGDAQLCQSVLTSGGVTYNTEVPAGLRVDFVRSSSNPTGKCTGIVGMGYADDGVPAVDFPTVNPSVDGALYNCNYAGTINGVAISTVCSNNQATDGYNSTTHTVPLGPVAAGWLPGDPAAGPYSGTAFSNLTNNVNVNSGGGIAYQIWCSGAIKDWGQLTNIAGTAGVGSGNNIGIPIFVWGINPGSGTVSVFLSYLNTGADGNPTCTTDEKEPTHGAPGVTNLPDATLENNTAQLATLAAEDNNLTAIPGYTPTNPYSNCAAPGGPYGTGCAGAGVATNTGIAGEAAQMSAGLYYMSFGVTQANNASTSTTVNGVTYPAAVMEENGVADSAAANACGGTRCTKFPTQRVLYNAYLSQSVRASTASFLNFICDAGIAGGGGGVFNKGIDYNSGVSYQNEVYQVITGEYGFGQLTDGSPTGTIGNPTGTPTCSLIASVSTTVDPASEEPIQGAWALPTATVSSGRTLTGTINLTSGSDVLTDTATDFASTDVGRTISDAPTNAIPAGTVIVAVINSTTVIMSHDASANETGDSVVLGNLYGNASTPTVIATNSSVSVPRGLAAGQLISGAGIPVATTITGVTIAPEQYLGVTYQLETISNPETTSSAGTPLTVQGALSYNQE